MELETERLILRLPQESDAEEMYKYAKDPLVGPIAGWYPHTSVENSREIIRDVLMKPGNFAVILKETGLFVGMIGITAGQESNLKLPEDEAEIGYWIGVPYWGQGLIPEAMREVIRYGFEDMGMKQLWCGYFDGNQKSKRAQEKCGFNYDHTDENIYWKLMDDYRTEHVTRLTRDAWEKQTHE